MCIYTYIWLLIIWLYKHTWGNIIQCFLSPGVSVCFSVSNDNVFQCFLSRWSPVRFSVFQYLVVVVVIVVVVVVVVVVTVSSLILSPGEYGY